MKQDRIAFTFNEIAAKHGDTPFLTYYKAPFQFGLHSDRGSQYCSLEYIEIFYNRQRIHEANEYLTPEEYFKKWQAA